MGRPFVVAVLYHATPMADTIKEKATDAWHRQLNDGRVEIMCRAPGFRIRVSAPEEQAWEAVELFEKWSGVTITSDRRPRRRPSQLPGQLAMTSITTELQLGDNGE